MADELSKEGVLAATNTWNPNSYRLTCAIETKPAGTFTRLTINWVLLDVDGKIIANETAGADVSDAPWRNGDPILAKALVAHTARILAHSIQGDVPTEHEVAATTVEIVPITGVAGDGGRALSLAIAAELGRKGVTLNKSAKSAGGKPSYVLLGNVEIGHPDAGRQTVKIVWILKAGDGKQIGQVTQENMVPAGSLDGKWGDTAYDIAMAAAGGIVALLQGPAPAGL